MAAPKPTQGLQNARSPGSIANNEHHLASGVKKSASGIAVALHQVIIPDSTVETPVGDYAPMWVCNTDTVVHYLYVGKQGAPAVSITTAIAIPPNFGRMVYGPTSDDPMKSIVIKSDSSKVQVIVMDES